MLAYSDVSKECELLRAQLAASRELHIAATKQNAELTESIQEWERQYNEQYKEAHEASGSLAAYLKSFDEYRREQGRNFADLLEETNYFKQVASERIMEVQELKQRKPWYRRSFREIFS